MFKGKCCSHDSVHQQVKLVKPLDHTSSDNNSKREVKDSASLTTEVTSGDQFNSPTKARSTWRTFIRKDINSPVKRLDEQPNIAAPLLRKREPNPKVISLNYFILFFGLLLQFLESLKFVFIHVYVYAYRKAFLTACLGMKHGDGVLLSGSIVQLIIHGSQKVSLLST